jgi:peptidoglycan-associated lipoprotein
MREHPEYTFTVEGHADERGTNDYNLALGQERAASASSYLQSLGVDAGRLRNISYGEERPVCTEQSETCWQRNRRAHFVITGRQ